MKTLEELRRLKTELSIRMKALSDKSVAGTFTDEDQVEWDAGIVEAEELRVAIAAAETRARQAGEYQFETIASQAAQSQGRAAGSVPNGQERPGNSSGEREHDLRSIGRRVIDSDQIRAFIAGGESGFATIDIRGGFYHAGDGDLSEILTRGGSRLMARETRGLVYTGSFPTGAVERDRIPGILDQQFARPTVRDAFGSTPTTSNLIAFVRHLLGSDTNAAAWVAEPSVHDGSTGLKPQSTLVFDGDEAPVREVANWIPISENIADDLPGLESMINNVLLSFNAQEEDDALINGDGIAPNLKGLLAQSGIQVADSAYFAANAVQDAGSSNEDYNRILAASELVRLVGLANASFVFVNPVGFQYLLTVTDDNRNYFGGGPFVVGALPRIWGIPIIVTDKLEDDQFIVGDGRMAEVRDRMQGTIDVGWINDQFVRDMKTIRAKQRLAFPVIRPGAFVDGEFAFN